MFQLSIPAKLVITVLIPIGLLLYLSIDKIDNSKERLRDLEAIQNRTNEIEYISGLVHEIQKERDFASLYLMDATLDAQKSFQSQIQETDSIFQIFQSQILENKSDTSVFQYSNQLKEYRAGISWFQFSQKEAEYNYNRIIEQYLSQISLMGAGSKIPETRTEINAYISLLWTKEYLGRLRTALIKTFTTGYFNGVDEYGVFATWKGGFESSLQNFQKISADEIKDRFQRDFGNSAARMLMIIDDVFEKPVMSPRFKYEADAWRYSSTIAINVLYDVELSSIYRIQSIVKSNIEKTESIIDKSFYLLSIAVILAILFSSLIIRSFTSQLSAIRKGALRISKGETDVHLNDSSDDAIGILAKSFNSLAKNANDLAIVAGQIGEGDYKVEVPVRGQKDQLGKSINEMKRNLASTTRDLIHKARILQEQNEEILLKNEEIEESKFKLQSQNEKLDQVNKYKSAFLANMSHELRTPLNSLLILSKVLASNEEGNLSSDQLESLQVMTTSGENLLELINDILDISKIEAGRLDVEISEVYLEELIKEMKGLFLPVANEKGIDFQVDIDTNKFNLIRTDKLRLGQILKNLLSNAFKFTPENGRVNLTFKLKNEMLEILIKDSGIGIDKDHQKLIFEAFKQVDGSISRNYGGTGLGLSISTQLAELLGGRIELKSEKGEGAEFSLIFNENILSVGEQLKVHPKNSQELKKDDETNRPSTSFILNDWQSSEFRFNDNEILFLESDITRVFELSSVLNPFGIQVAEVDCWDHLEEKVRKGSFSILIMSLKDLNENFEDVFDFLEKLKLPVVILAPNNELKRQLPTSVNWLNEPLSITQLVNLLKQN